jgi:hypothetical protein
VNIQINTCITSNAMKVPDNLLGKFQKRVTRGRQGDRIGTPVDKRCAKPPLQCLEAPTECGVSDMSQFGRARKIAGFGNRYEIFQPFEFHFPLPKARALIEVWLLGQLFQFSAQPMVNAHPAWCHDVTVLS